MNTERMITNAPKASGKQPSFSMLQRAGQGNMIKRLLVAAVLVAAGGLAWNMHYLLSVFSLSVFSAKERVEATVVGFQEDRDINTGKPVKSVLVNTDEFVCDDSRLMAFPVDDLGPLDRLTLGQGDRVSFVIEKLLPRGWQCSADYSGDPVRHYVW